MRGTVRCPPFRVLAHCDLSTLQNGTYEMRLTARAGFVTTNTSVLFALDSNLKIDALGRVSEQYDFKKQRKLVRYDRLGRVATNFWFESASDYPSNSTEYYYNALGQLTNITERAGADASSTYFVRVPPPHHRKRYFAALAKVPPEVKGGVSGFALAAFSAIGLLLSRLRPLSGVAQTCSLLYRRLAVCNAREVVWSRDCRRPRSVRLPGRLQICDTADCKSALLLRADRRTSLFSPFAPVKSLFAYFAYFAVKCLAASVPSVQSVVKRKCVSAYSAYSAVQRRSSLTSVKSASAVKCRSGFLTGGKEGNRVLAFRFFQSLLSLFAPVKPSSPSVLSVPSVVKRKCVSAYSAYSAVQHRSSLTSVKSASALSKTPRSAFRTPHFFWRYSTALVIICLLGSDPRLDFWSLHAQSCPRRVVGTGLRGAGRHRELSASNMAQSNTRALRHSDRPCGDKGCFGKARPTCRGAGHNDYYHVHLLNIAHAQKAKVPWSATLTG
jgi:hypothetical protein